MKIKRTIGSVASSIMCLSLITGNVSAVEADYTKFDVYKPADYISNDFDIYKENIISDYNIDAENLCIDFVNMFYSNIYVEEYTSFTTECLNSDGLSDYLTLKSAVMRNRSAIYGKISDFSVSSVIEERSDIEPNNESLYTIWVEVEFKYPGCDTFSGFGRTVPGFGEKY